MPFSLRPATPADLPQIAAMMNAAFRGVGPDAGWNSEADLIAGDRTSLAALASDLAAGSSSTLLVAEDAATLLGSVHLDPRSGNVWYLGGLTVSSRLQNAGLGRQILAAAEHWALARGATTIQMTVVNLRATLIAWYQRRGYHLTGETRPFPYNDNRFGTPLRDDLSFVVLEKALHAEPSPA